MAHSNSLIDLVAAAVKVADKGIEKGKPYNETIGFVTNGLAAVLLEKALRDETFAENLLGAAGRA